MMTAQPADQREECLVCARPIAPQEEAMADDCAEIWMHLDCWNELVERATVNKPDKEANRERVVY